MPIIIQCDQGDAPLAQGDLLGVGEFYSAGASVGGEPEGRDYPYMLVVSRDCAAINKKAVIVAPVAEMATEPDFGGKKLKDLGFDEAKEYVEQLREGVSRPDRFYLGNFPGSSVRLWAHLDELGTQSLPEGEAARAEWVRTRRVACLAEDFIRALPVRLFGSVSRIGFHDYEWWADQDLLWLVQGINAAISKEEAELAQAEAALLAPAGGRRDLGAEKNVANRRAELDKHRREFAPHIQELARRQESPASR